MLPSIDEHLLPAVGQAGTYREIGGLHLAGWLASWFFPALAQLVVRLVQQAAEPEGRVLSRPAPTTTRTTSRLRQAALLPLHLLLTAGLEGAALAGTVVSRAVGWMGAVLGWGTQTMAEVQETLAMLAGSPLRQDSPLPLPTTSIARNSAQLRGRWWQRVLPVLGLLPLLVSLLATGQGKARGTDSAAEGGGREAAGVTAISRRANSASLLHLELRHGLHPGSARELHRSSENA